MKKVLLGTTALVSAVLVAQQAQAADHPIELNVGGYQNWATYLVNNDNGAGSGTLPAQPGFNRYDNRIVFDGEIQFKGKTVLDNGLEVGVRFELEGEQQGDQMDETYAYIEGSFGTFRVGNDDPMAVQMATAAPYLNYMFGANSATIFTNGLSQFYSATGRTAAGGGYATFTTFPGMTSDDAQLMYFTPVFNGFQFGISYAPSQGEARSGGGYGLGTRTGAGSALAEEYSIAGRYDGEVGDLGVTAAMGIMEAKGRTVTSTVEAADMQGWDAGLVLYYGNWGFGASYLNVSDMRGFNGTDQLGYDLGIAYYSDGAWSAGIYYLHSETEYAAGALGADAGPVAYAGGAVTDDFDAFRLQSQYDLGPGIAVTGTVGLDQFDDGGTNTSYDTYFMGTGLMLSF